MLIPPGWTPRHTNILHFWFSPLTASWWRSLADEGIQSDSLRVVFSSHLWVSLRRVVLTPMSSLKSMKTTVLTLMTQTSVHPSSAECSPLGRSLGICTATLLAIPFTGKRGLRSTVVLGPGPSPDPSGH